MALKKARVKNMHTVRKMPDITFILFYTIQNVFLS